MEIYGQDEDNLDIFHHHIDFNFKILQKKKISFTIKM